MWSTSWRPCDMELPREIFLYTSAMFMWRLCLIIRDVINTCDDTIHNLSDYVYDWSLGAHKILHPILSLKLGVTLCTRIETPKRYTWLFTSGTNKGSFKSILVVERMCSHLLENMAYKIWSFWQVSAQKLFSGYIQRNILAMSMGTITARWSQ